MQSVYVETSIASYLTARPSRDLRAAAWQQTTLQWWEQERLKYELFTSELVLAEARGGDADAAGRLLAHVELPTHRQRHHEAAHPVDLRSRRTHVPRDLHSTGTPIAGE